jgi:hypothetical protein
MSARGRDGTALLGALVVDSVGNGLFLPLSLLFFLKLTAVPLGLLGVLLSLATTLTLPVPLWAGWLADRVGALPLVVAAQVLQGAGYLAYDQVHGPVGIGCAAGLVATGVRLFWSSVFTALADFADTAAARGAAVSKDTWYAWASVARTAGLGAGGVVAGVVVANGGVTAYRAVAYVAAGCFLCAAGTIAVFVRAPRRLGGGQPARDRVGYRGLLRDRTFLAFGAINTVYAGTSIMLPLALPAFVLRGLHGSPVLASAVLVGNTVLLTVAGAAVIRRLAPYRRSRVLIAAGALWTVGALLFAVLVPRQPGWVIPALVGAALLFTVAELVHAPVSMALATALSPVAARGRYLAAFQYSFMIASMVAPAFFTTLFEVHRSLPWLAVGLVNVLAVFATRRLERVVPPAAQRVTTGVG